MLFRPQSASDEVIETKGTSCFINRCILVKSGVECKAVSVCLSFLSKSRIKGQNDFTMTIIVPIRYIQGIQKYVSTSSILDIPRD